MGKISPVSIKYIIHADLELTGVAERPDIIGAIFGQTEGLLGTELELRELQKSGRIGRIDVKLESKGGKTNGEILLPSSMGKTETAIIAAALETIERVGPCDAKIKVTKIEDVRVAKRNFVLERAKELLQQMITDMPDTQAFTTMLTQGMREAEIIEYGKDRLPAGPDIDNVDEIIIVEGRADVLNLLRYGIRNVIGMKGAKPTDTVIDLTKKKITTLFVDGDRGGDLIIKNLAGLTDLDFVARAPDGKEVEELQQKEILKALRLKIPWEQAKNELKNGNGLTTANIPPTPEAEHETYAVERVVTVSGRNYDTPKHIKQFKSMSEEILGTRGAFILDENLNILGRVPVKELEVTLKDLDGVYAVVMDGEISQALAKIADNKGIRYLVAQAATARPLKAKVLTPERL
ncbi:MAG: DNA primase DnaG [Candidatus Nanoarchaeia archaeon]